MERLKLPRANKCRIPNSVHLLIVGKSHEHVKRIIYTYCPNHVSLFTSLSLEEATFSFASSLQKEGMTISTITINPFSKESIYNIIAAIKKEYLRLTKIYPAKETEYFIGVTGGTNLMAIGAALAAWLLGIKIHYVLKPDTMLPESREIIEIDMEKLPKECKKTTSFCT